MDTTVKWSEMAPPCSHQVHSLLIEEVRHWTGDYKYRYKMKEEKEAAKMQDWET